MYKKILNALFISIFIQLKTFSALFYQVTKDNIHVRLDSTIMSEAIGTLNKGEIVEVLKEKYDWCQIRLPKRFACFVKSEFVKLLDTNRGAVTALNLNLRQQPSTDSYILGIAKKDSLLTVYEEKEGWFKVNCYPYATGWVHKQFLRPIDKLLTKKGYIFKSKKTICNTNYILRTDKIYAVKAHPRLKDKFINKKLKIVAKVVPDECNSLIIKKLSLIKE